MGAEHTPGPWGYFHDTCASCAAKGEKEFIIEGPPGGSHGQFSHEPDARLIAQAPELLWFAQQIRNAYHTGLLDSPADETLANVMRRGLAAIEAAEAA